MRKQIEKHILPLVRERAEQQRAKEARRLREIQNTQKLATAKRSSRIAGKMEKQKAVEEAEEAERKRQLELEMVKREQQRQRMAEESRGSRLMTREQRIKEREVKRILHEQELAKLEESRNRAQSDEARISERHLKAEMDRRQAELDKLAQEDDWWFDCSVCGTHGQNIVRLSRSLNDSVTLIFAG